MGSCRKTYYRVFAEVFSAYIYGDICLTYMYTVYFYPEFPCRQYNVKAIVNEQGDFV